MKKTLSYLRWAFYAILVAGIYTFLSLFLFPLAYLLRGPLREWYEGTKVMYGPILFFNWATIILAIFFGTTLYKIILLVLTIFPLLWIFLDDESYLINGDDYGSEIWREQEGIEINTGWQKFIAAYKWGVIRNPAWNMYSIFRTKKGDPTIISEKGYLERNGVSWPLINSAVIKWEDGEGNYTDNNGKCISKKFSIFGKSKIWYEIDNTLYWRYTFAGKKKFLWWEYMEIQLGTNDKRYKIRFKVKNAEMCN